MRIERVGDFRCPDSGSLLRLADPVVQDGAVLSGALVSADDRRYPIEGGIPNFLDPARLSAIEERTKSEYDLVADEIYDVAVDWLFAALYEDEAATRESMVD